jgi:hypothetical protein
MPILRDLHPVQMEIKLLFEKVSQCLFGYFLDHVNCGGYRWPHSVEYALANIIEVNLRHTSQTG